VDIETALVDLHEYLAIPYVAVVYSVERDDGEWVRRAEYPELPDCWAEAVSATDAIEQLEEARVRVLIELQRRGEEPPRPRPPLRSGVSGLSRQPLEDLLRRALLDTATS
jgi:predicted RNase H-like HicB family nuclease